MFKKIAICFVFVFVVVGANKLIEEAENTKFIKNYLSQVSYGDIMNFNFELKELHPDNYDEIMVGYWIDNNYVWHAAVTYTDDTLKAVAVKNNVRIVQVKYSYTQLEEISNEVLKLDCPGVHESFINIKMNAIEVFIDIEYEEQLQKIIASTEYLQTVSDAIIIIPIE